MPFDLTRDITQASPEFAILVYAAVALLYCDDYWLGWVGEDLLYCLNGVLLMNGAS
ncbi:hypothetical protein OUHCRE4_43200 [Enterobacter hormaechei subsp. steigerwaltii]